MAVARTRLEKTLTRVKAELGPAHSLVAEVLNALGIVGKAESRFTDAARCYRRALVILRNSRSTGPLELADLYHNLGGLEHARGRYAIGEPLARRSVQLRARRHGPDATIVWKDRTAHAALLDGLGRYAESEPVYRRALAVFRKRLGANDYEVAVTLNNLGCARAALGDPRSGARFLRQALIVKEGLFGSTSVEAALTIHNLATAIEDSGRSREAAPLFRRAASLLRRRLGANHPIVIAVSRSDESA
ncbi:MAG: tetratricopeptide repeat protein [Gemmatimonadaceae bacterium]